MLLAVSQNTYDRTLREAFLPRIGARLEERLRASQTDHVELIYDTLKAYLMLFGGRSFDRDALRAYLLADWQETLPAGTPAETQAALRRHLDRLLAGGEVGAPSNANSQLIARARSLVASVPPAQRAYQRIRQLDIASAAAPFSAESAGGPTSRRLFVRASGQALAQGIPALYTRSVFQQTLAEQTRDVLRQFARERAWVLGSGVPVAIDVDEQQALAAEVQRLYFADYVRRWDDYLADLRLAPAPTLGVSAEQATLLARPDSPLTALLRAAADQLSILPRADASADAAFARLDALRRYVAEPPGVEPLQPLLGTLAAHLTAVDDAARRQTVPPTSNVTRDLTAAAQHAPEPVRGMLVQLASTGASQAFSALREPLSRQVASELAPQCARLLGAQYPIVRNGNEELSREAFTRAFAAGGLIDSFFQRQLSPHVDTSVRPWAFRAGAGGAEALQPFERAQAIREAFFRDGGRQFGVRLEMRLLELESGIAEFVLDVDGQALRFKPGASAQQTLLWPGPADSGRVLLQLVPSTGPAGAGHTFQGPWALFRMLDHVRSDPGPTPDRWRLRFDVEGRKALFEVRASAALNPIARQELEQFQCPKRL
jgi:type VI secretion system protein ImpL